MVSSDLGISNTDNFTVLANDAAPKSFNSDDNVIRCRFWHSANALTAIVVPPISPSI